MEKKSNGFTLIELLAVLVILIAILSIAVPSVISTVERKKQKDLEEKKGLFISSSETLNALYHKESDFYYYREYFFEEICGYDADFLVEYNVLSSNEAKDINGNKIEGCVMYDIVNKEYVFEDNCIKKCSEVEIRREE